MLSETALRSPMPGVTFHHDIPYDPLPERGASANPALMLQVVDQQGIIIDVSDRWLQSLGYIRSSVVGRHYADFITAATRKLAETLYIPTLLEAGQIREIECEFIKADQQTLPVTTSAMVRRTARRSHDFGTLCRLRRR